MAGQAPSGSSSTAAGPIAPHYVYGKNAINSAGRHGDAILSKHPFVSWENINIASHNHADRSLLHAVIGPPGNGLQVHVICIHLGSSAAGHRRRIGLVAARITSHVQGTRRRASRAEPAGRTAACC